MVSHHLRGFRAELAPEQSPKASLGPHELYGLPLPNQAIKANRLSIQSRTSCGFLDHTLSGLIPDSVENYHPEGNGIAGVGKCPA